MLKWENYEKQTASIGIQLLEVLSSSKHAVGSQLPSINYYQLIIHPHILKVAYFQKPKLTKKIFKSHTQKTFIKQGKFFC